MKNILNKLKIDESTYFLILLALLAGYFKNIFLIFLIVIIHEIGHIISFIYFNIEIDKVCIYPFGGLTIVNNKIHERIYKSLICASAGLIAQIFLFIIFYFLFQKNYIHQNTYEFFLKYNKIIFFFNLLPIIPLDGSKIVLNILSKYISYKKSYSLMLIISLISLALFIIFNILFKLNDLMLILFLIFKFYEAIKNYKYLINKFYLERILYDNYYDGIINNCSTINKLRLNKYYFFKEKNHFINEKEYLIKNKY